MITGVQFEILRDAMDGSVSYPADGTMARSFASLERRGLLERHGKSRWTITKAGKEAVRRHSTKGKES